MDRELHKDRVMETKVDQLNTESNLRWDQKETSESRTEPQLRYTIHQVAKVVSSSD
jgi:hypothetical protein